MLSRSTRGLSNPRDRQQLCVERLDARVMLSAVPPGALVATEAPAAAPLAASSPPDGIDGQAFMQGLMYTFSQSDFGFLDPGDTPPDVCTGIRIASLPARGYLTAFGSGVGVGQVISVQSILAGDLQYSTSGVESIPYDSFTFQVQDDGDLSGGGSNQDPTPNRFTLFFDDARVAYVRNLYQDILERSPETAGLVHWIDQINDSVSNLQIARDLWNSFEHRAIQVDEYYQRFLDRAPDAAGRDGWIAQLQGGKDEEDVMVAFMATTEYQLNHSSNQGFVAAIYQDLFSRTPDSAGEQYWLDQLNSGQMTRETVASALVQTRERYLGLVAGYYDEFYSRLPDPEGLEFWVSQLEQNALDEEALAELLLTTNEYLGQPPGGSF